MEFSAPSAVMGALGGTGVLVAAMFLVARSPGAPRSLRAFAAAFGLNLLRYVVLLTGPAGATTTILAESLHGAGAMLLLAGAAMELGRPLPPAWLVAGCGLQILWLGVAVPLLGVTIGQIPVSLVVGGAMLAAGWAFWHRARRLPGAGYGVVALLFGLWGLHKWDYPWISQVAWLQPMAFLVSQFLATALGIVLVVAADRERRHAHEDGRKRDQSLLRLQSEAMSAAANAIFITDRAGRIEWCNAAFTRLNGYACGEAKGKSARRLLWGGRPPDKDGWQLMDAIAKGRGWSGELNLRRRDGTLYTVDQTVTPILDESSRLAHYVVVQEDITDRRRAEERVRFLSNHDALTALPNRLLFRENLQRAIARAQAGRRTLVVLFVDLERFSRYNDILGHERCDALLTSIVERLGASVRGAEMLARVGGDEFAVLLADGAGVKAAAETAQTLLEAIVKPYDADGHEVTVGASVGIALYPEDGEDADSLIKCADMAMYRAIREAPNGYRFFRPEMDSELAARRQLEADLRKAVSRGEFLLHYQPIVALATRRVVGFEALLRWDHPIEGLVTPGLFIPLAEETGLIAAIGEWALREACSQARRWTEDGLPAVPVAVNMSTLQMRRQDLPLLIRRVLQETRLPPQQLEIELTESAIMHDPEAAQRVLAEIKGQGVRLAVDDFGTGYSSMARLKDFPVDKLKIDRSFIADLAEDPGSAAIARAIVSLGHALGLQVVSEGVETEAQAAYLHRENCDSVQGFLFSPPVPAHEAALLLRRGGFV